MTKYDKFIVVFGLSAVLLVIAIDLRADQLVHKFKNPSFSGTNTSSHYLTIENQEFNRKELSKRK